MFYWPQPCTIYSSDVFTLRPEILNGIKLNLNFTIQRGAKVYIQVWNAS